MEQIKRELKEILEGLSNQGYKCYITTPDDWNCGYIITPNDNVLYIQWGCYGGWTFSLEYMPNRNCGSGCQCLKNPVGVVNSDIVKQAEHEGLSFAYRLKAQLYKNSEQWFDRYWAKDRLELVELEDK